MSATDDIRLSADASKIMRQLKESQSALRRVSHLDRMMVMLETAAANDRVPVRWVVGRTVSRALRNEETPWQPAERILGVPVEHDPNTATGWGLVVR